MYITLAVLCAAGQILLIFLVNREGRKNALNQIENNIITEFHKLDSEGRKKFLSEANLNKEEIISQINKQTKQSATDIISEVQDVFGIIKTDLDKYEFQISELNSVRDREIESALSKINSGIKREKSSGRDNLIKGISRGYTDDQLKYIYDSLIEQSDDPIVENAIGKVLVHRINPIADSVVYKKEFYKTLNNVEHVVHYLILKGYKGHENFIFLFLEDNPSKINRIDDLINNDPKFMPILNDKKVIDLITKERLELLIKILIDKRGIKKEELNKYYIMKRLKNIK